LVVTKWKTVPVGRMYCNWVHIAGANIWRSSYLLSISATAAATGRMGFSMWIYFGLSFRHSR